MGNKHPLENHLVFNNDDDNDDENDDNDDDHNTVASK